MRLLSHDIVVIWSRWSQQEDIVILYHDEQNQFEVEMLLEGSEELLFSDII